MVGHHGDYIELILHHNVVAISRNTQLVEACLCRRQVLTRLCGSRDAKSRVLIEVQKKRTTFFFSAGIPPTISCKDKKNKYVFESAS